MLSVKSQNKCNFCVKILLEVCGTFLTEKVKHYNNKDLSLLLY